MKRTHRILAITLVLVMLFADGNLAALAEGVLTMPTALQIIDEESFYGASSIDKVVLSNKVTEIRARAFANSTLSEINFPASLTYIAEDAFDGPDKVTVTAIEGTYAYDWAVDHGYISPNLTIRSFSSNVSEANIGDIITWTATIQGGTKEYSYQYTVYNGKNIVMTTGYSDSASFSYSPASVGEYYVRVTVDDGEDSVNLKTESAVAVSKTDLRITSINTSAESAMPGDTVYWTVKTIGGESGLTYDYVLKRDGLQIDSVLNSRNNFYSGVLEEKGVYILTVTVRDSSGASVSMSSDTVMVGLQPVQIYDISFDGLLPAASGENLTWNVIANEGTPPYTYIYTLLIDGEEITGSARTESSYTYENAQADHSYTLHVTCMDSNGMEANAISSPVLVYPRESIIAPAPTLLCDGGETVFGISEVEAPSFYCREFHLSWEPIENADSYHLKLSKKANDNWETVLEENEIDLCEYTLSSSLFTEISSLYRLEISSNAVRAGKVSEYYFFNALEQIDTAILVNDKASLSWGFVSAQSSVRYVNITSALPWTASSDSNWLHAQAEGTQLRIELDENDTGSTLEGEITVSNGAQACQIYVYHGATTEAPSIENPALSTDINHPTILPLASLKLGLNFVSDYLRIAVEALESDTGYAGVGYSYIRSQSSGTSYTLSVEEWLNNALSSITVAALAREDANKSEYDPDFTTTYYVLFRDDAFKIQANGQEHLVLCDPEQYVVNVTANSAWTYSIQDDWLHVPKSTNYQLKISADPNLTTAERTGTILLSCGSKTSTIEVKQASQLPFIEWPVSLSQSESSPTIMYGYTKGDNFKFVLRNFKTATWSYKSNSAYVVDDTLTNWTTYTELQDRDICDLGYDDVQIGKIYRITLGNDDISNVYYVKFSSKTQYISINSSTDREHLAIGSNGGQKEYTIKTNAKWTASANETWLHVSKSSGNANENGISFSFTVDPNESDNFRLGYITFACSGNPLAYIQVTQNPVEYLTIFTSGVEYDPAIHFTEVSGQQNYDVKFSCGTNAYKLDVRSDVNWLDIDKVDGSNNYEVFTSANSVESSRTGHITVKAGDVVKTITVTQLPALGEIDEAWTAPGILGSSSSNPAVLAYDNIVMNWNAVTNAVRYQIGLYSPITEKYTYYEVPGVQGNMQYQYVIPVNTIAFSDSGTYRLQLRAYDSCNNSKYYRCYFRFALADCAYANGSTTPVWDDVSDVGDAKDFTIHSTESWTAVSRDAWILLSQNQGDSGDVLELTVLENQGSARQGKVVVSVNGNDTEITVNQFAYLAQEKPSLVSPQLSVAYGNPTILDQRTSITAIWVAEPQAYYYEIVLKETTGSGKWETVRNSGRLYEIGEYTFSGLTLNEHALYCIQLYRKSERWGITSQRYYFMLKDTSASLDLGWLENTVHEEEPEGDYIRTEISSSGYWVAQSSTDWLLLSDEAVSAQAIAEYGLENYLSHGGIPSDDLYITILPNEGQTRTGYVNVRCGGLTKTITVKQLGDYEIALFTTSYSEDSTAPTEINLGSLSLSWTKANGGSGTYRITVGERDKNYSFKFYEIYSKTVTEPTRSITIPQSKFEQNGYYRIKLYTVMPGESAQDAVHCQTIYLYVGYGNSLLLSPVADWSQNYIGGIVTVQANASGGSGEYQYVYRLLSNGTVIKDSNDASGRTKQAWYSFTLDQTGTYQVEVTVYDAKTQKTLTRTCGAGITVTEEIRPEISLSQTVWQPDSAGAGISVTVTANMDWDCRGSDGWITVTKNSSTEGYISVTANDTGNNRTGRAIFNIGGVGMSVEIAQEPVSTPQDSTLKLTPSVWPVSGFIASSTSVLVSSDGDWSISAYPDWVIPSSLTGSRGDRVSFYAGPNPTEETRQGDVVFVCGTATGSFTVIQSANDFQPCVERVEFSKVEVLTGENVTMTVTVRNAVEVQLWVDGNLLTENTATVWGNTATVVRAFSKSGERKIQLRALREDGVSVFSDEYNISVSTNGENWGPLVVSAPEEVIQGEKCTVYWGSVGETAEYTVYLYAGNEQLWKQSVNNKTFIELTNDDLFNIDSYTVLVIATAKGYSQIQGGTIIKVISREAEQSPFIEYRIGNIAKQTLKKTTESKLLYARTDSSVDSVTVLLKGTEIPLIKDISASTDSEYVFTKTVNPPSEGLNEYNFVATKKNGQTYSGAWSRHWMYTYNETPLINYTNKENTFVYSIQGKKQDELPINYQVTVLGTMLGRAYVRINGIDSFIDYDNLSPSKRRTTIDFDKQNETVYITGKNEYTFTIYSPYTTEQVSCFVTGSTYEVTGKLSPISGAYLYGKLIDQETGQWSITIPTNITGKLICTFYISENGDNISEIGNVTIISLTGIEQPCWASYRGFSLYDFDGKLIKQIKNPQEYSFRCKGGINSRNVLSGYLSTEKYCIEATSLLTGEIYIGFIESSFYIQLSENLPVYRSIQIYNYMDDYWFFQFYKLDVDRDLGNIDYYNAILDMCEFEFETRKLLKGKSVETISKELVDFLALADYNDVTYIYWSSHGVENLSHHAAHEWLVVKEGITISAQYYKYSTLASILKNAAIENTGEIRVIIDSCFAGDFRSDLIQADVPTSNVTVILGTQSDVYGWSASYEYTLEDGTTQKIGMTYSIYYMYWYLHDNGIRIPVGTLVSNMEYDVEHQGRNYHVTPEVYGDTNKRFFAPVNTN